AARDAGSQQRDQERRGERRDEADPGGDDHPRRMESLSTSRSRRLRAIATIRPSPTTTSEAATAITASAKIWPLDSPCRRENAIRARFAPKSMSSGESSTISGLRRRRTPRAPVANRNAATARYQAMSGPRTDLSFVDQLAGRRRAARVCAEDDRADRRDEQHDRGDLQREQVIGQKHLPDPMRRAEAGVDRRLV